MATDMADFKVVKDAATDGAVVSVNGRRRNDPRFETQILHVYIFLL